MRLTENEIKDSQKRIEEILSVYTLTELYKQKASKVVAGCWKCDNLCDGKSDECGNY